MAKIDLNNDSLGDWVISFLLDCLLNPDEIKFKNDDFNDFIDLLDNRGFQPHLLKYYLGTNSSTRMNYKRIRNVLTGISKTGMITLNSTKNEKESEPEIITQTKQTAINKIVQLFNKLK